MRPRGVKAESSSVWPHGSVPHVLIIQQPHGGCGTGTLVLSTGQAPLDFQSQKAWLSSFDDRQFMTPTDDHLADLARALAHPARLRILRLLMATPGCIGGDIVNAVGLAQSTVSEHLRILKSAGLIRGEIAAPRICYALNPPALVPLSAFIAGLTAPDSALCCIPEPKARHEPV